jgi:hypothetical protein
MGKMRAIIEQELNDKDIINTNIEKLRKEKHELFHSAKAKYTRRVLSAQRRDKNETIGDKKEVADTGGSSQRPNRFDKG